MQENAVTTEATQGVHTQTNSYYCTSCTRTTSQVQVSETPEGVQSHTLPFPPTVTGQLRQAPALQVPDNLQPVDQQQVYSWLSTKPDTMPVSLHACPTTCTHARTHARSHTDTQSS